jgi:hypothetical protein
MLVDENVLIVPFAYHLQSGLNEPACRQADKTKQQKITSTALTLLSSSWANKSRNISTAESLAVVWHGRWKAYDS